MSDTAQIILAVIGTGITLLGILVGLLVSLFRIQRHDLATLRQEMDNGHKDIHQTLASLRQEMRTDIASLHARIDNLYQALFSHKDSAA